MKPSADKIQPKWGNLLIKRDELPKQIGSLVLPEVHADHAKSGRIIRTGHTVERFREGQHVLFREFAGVVFEIDGDEYMVLPQEDVLAVLREVEA